MTPVGLEGDRVRLVPPDRSIHLENALAWFNDPEVTATLEQNFGVSRRQEEEFFDRIESPGDADLVWAIHDRTGRHIGFIGLHGIHWRHRKAHGGLILGDRSSWGLGFATDAVRVRSRFVFETMGLHRLEGHTINPAMCRVYEKAGYRHEGTARRLFWRGGRWHDAQLYAILEADHFGEGA